MLAPLLIASLATCMLIMLLGWVPDGLDPGSDVGAACPLFPMGSSDASGVLKRDRALVARLPKRRVFIASRDGPGT